MAQQNGGPYGLGAAGAGNGESRVSTQRGQNIGCQSYMLLFPETGQGIVVLTGSDNGTTLATALIPPRGRSLQVAATRPTARLTKH